MAPGLSRRARSVALTLPLAAFLAATFLAPLGVMLWRSIYEPDVADALPRTLALLAAWNGRQAPSEQVFDTAAGELLALHEKRALGRVATDVNRVAGGTRSVIVRTARRLHGSEPESWRAVMVAADSAWGEARIWGAIRGAGHRYTARHYLHALDLDLDIDGRVVRQSERRAIYLELLGRTLLSSAGVTVVCLLLGYPLAFVIAHSRRLVANIVLAMVLVPFTMSLIARSIAWLILLQNEGVVNDVLVGLGLVADEERLSLAYNLGGTLVTLSHSLLPFLVLPLYAVLHTIPKDCLRAATSLGANPWQLFRHVYWPQSLPGVGAGALLVFILAIGQFVAPAVVGGRTGQFISNLIAYHMQTSLNWGLAAALSFVLLACVAVVYLLYDRLFGIERLRLDP